MTVDYSRAWYLYERYESDVFFIQVNLSVTESSFFARCMVLNLHAGGIFP